MKLANELWVIAMNAMTRNAKPYIRRIKRRARWAARSSNMRCTVVISGKARHVRVEIADALYKEGFSVTTKYFDSVNDLDVVVDWSQPEEPRQPVHINI
ncbi:hypothetical protein Thu_234 [Bacillus phage Thurquoise]|nr:hypothetical protein Thu_234 [Bacillus phage Thurquoise]